MYLLRPEHGAPMDLCSELGLNVESRRGRGTDLHGAAGEALPRQMEGTEVAPVARDGGWSIELPRRRAVALFP